MELYFIKYFDSTNPLIGYNIMSYRNGRGAHSIETKILMSIKKKGYGTGTKWNEQRRKNREKALSRRPLIICPHCGHECYNKASMVVAHFDHCKKNINRDEEFENNRRAIISNKQSLSKKNKASGNKGQIRSQEAKDKTKLIKIVNKIFKIINFCYGYTYKY